MSPELIAAVTRQAETDAEKIDVRQASNGAPLQVVGGAAPAGRRRAGAAVPGEPRDCPGLAQRQLLGEQEIPRRVHLTALNARGLAGRARRSWFALPPRAARARATGASCASGQ